MSMQEKHIPIQISAPYCTLNSLTPHTKRIWLVFHGYGMLARYFIKKFEILPPNENFIIAPQGLSKFYLEGFSGRIGATWMTKEDRLTEIANQQAMIKTILLSEVPPNHPAELILFGFSQGTATASRFGAFTSPLFSTLVLWAGMFPDDLKPEDTAHWPKDLRIIYFTGKQDPYLQPGMIERQHELIKNATGKNPELIEFDGKHEVISDLLLLI